MSANYREPEDLLSDESFLSWYFKTGKEGEKSWELWMANDTDRTRLVQQAVALLEATRQQENPIPAPQAKAAETTLFNKIEALDAATSTKILPLYRDRRWRVAVAILLALGIGLILAKSRSSRPEVRTEFGQLGHRQL